MNQDEASTSADGKAPPRKNDAKGALPLSVSSHDPAADAVRASLTAGLFRLMENDPLARRGDAEGVHQMRTAARRLRAELRAFGPLLETAWNEALDRELRWLGKMLG
ncbi:MAG TPA: CHAD domain-containing protein, partial [Isosphaeraceae bacterium]|nr:CHAD domain-containing protein [Isosphaeraceae bacterium]